jgi:hypothetical protein
MKSPLINYKAKWFVYPIYDIQSQTISEKKKDISLLYIIGYIVYIVIFLFFLFINLWMYDI